METEHHQVSAASTEAANSLILPEGSQMMIHDGEEYVTIVQDGQTYAIPLTEYQTMQPGGTITIQAGDKTTRPNLARTGMSRLSIIKTNVIDRLLSFDKIFTIY